MPGETGTARSGTERSLSTSVIQAGQSMCDGQPKEYFWGCTLTTASNTFTWSTDDEENDEDFLQHTLFLRHAMLGSGASDDRHIVEIETKDFCGDTVKMPIFSLKMGLNEMVVLDLNFPNGIPVTIRLTEGAGPIHISGQQLLEFPNEEELDDTEAMTEEEAEEEEAEEEEVGSGSEEEEETEEDKKKATATKTTKRKASATKANKKAKKGRRDRGASENGTDEDEEDEEEEEEEEAEESMEDDDEDDDDYEEEKKGKKTTKPKGKGARVVKKKEKPASDSDNPQTSATKNPASENVTSVGSVASTDVSDDCCRSRNVVKGQSKRQRSRSRTLSPLSRPSIKAERKGSSCSFM